MVLNAAPAQELEIHIGAWSGDGSKIAVAAAGGPILIYDAASGSSAPIWRGAAGRDSGDCALALSPDGKRVAFGGETGPLYLGTVGATTLQSLQLPVGESSRALAWSRDGRRVTCGTQKSLITWDADAAKLLTRAPSPGNPDDLAWETGDSGFMIVSGSAAWHANAQGTVASAAKPFWPNQNADFAGARLTPDGRWAIAGDSGENHVFHVLTLFDTAAASPLPLRMVPLGDRGLLLAGNAGDWIATPGAEASLSVLVNAGSTQQTMTPGAFAARFHANQPLRAALQRR